MFYIRLNFTEKFSNFDNLEIMFEICMELLCDGVGWGTFFLFIFYLLNAETVESYQ